MRCWRRTTCCHSRSRSAVRNDAFSHLRDVVLPAESFTALSLDGAVGAHPLGVGGPLAWPTGMALSHAHNFRTFVYP